MKLLLFVKCCYTINLVDPLYISEPSLWLPVFFTVNGLLKRLHYQKYTLKKEPYLTKYDCILSYPGLSCATTIICDNKLFEMDFEFFER